MVISLTLIFESDAKIIKNVIGWARQRKYIFYYIICYSKMISKKRLQAKKYKPPVSLYEMKVIDDIFEGGGG